MSDSLQLTIVYEEGEDGWIIVSIPEVAGVHSQGKTRADARANVIDALRAVLAVRFGNHASASDDSETLELVINA